LVVLLNKSLSGVYLLGKGVYGLGKFQVDEFGFVFFFVVKIQRRLSLRLTVICLDVLNFLFKRLYLVLNLKVVSQHRLFIQVDHLLGLFQQQSLFAGIKLF
jgi:hypothetical protein